MTTRDGRLTTTEALNREQKIIQLAKAGKDSQIPLSSIERAEAVSQTRSLNQGQTTALKQMVTSRDNVILIQGNAGVGKTYTMKAFASTVGDKQPIRGLAPSAAAADVLQKESGITSQTLASYLLTPTEQLPPQEVILVDEASMISTRSTEQLLEKARSLKSRVILIGDTKQLSAIETGAPFKLLQEASLPTAIIDQNLRQRDPSLKQVVNSLATHDKNPDSVNEAYQKLNQSGKIKQIEEDETRIKAISDDYLSRPIAVRQKTLILASTNGDKQAIASAVRQGLINEGTLGDNNLQIQTLRRKNIDKFALTQAHHYQRGDVIKFQTDSARFSKDLYYRVTSINPETQTATLIDTVGITETLELNKYKQREVYQLQELEIRPGERMRFTKNILHSDYKQLNGQRFIVENISSDGQIVINTNGKTQNIDLERLLHSDYSYVDTVHSSQGQTADYCIYSAAKAKSLTIGRESFYVAASRARQEFVAYTASTQDLGVTVQISRANENAQDLVNSSVTEEKVVNNAQSKLQATQTVKPQQDKPSLTLTEQTPQLEQRAKRSNLKNRKTRKPSETSHSRNPGQFIAKIKQFASNIFTDNQNAETGEVWSSQQIGSSDDYQTPRTAQGNLDYSIDYQFGDLATQPHQSPQQNNTSRDQGQSQQQRNPSQSNREQARKVKPSPTAPLSQPLSKDEVNQIVLTATSAIKHGSERNKKTTFNNSYYQIEKFSGFETYGYRSYLTIDAKDGRGRLLTMKGHNFHPANLKVQENNLTKQDALTFEKIQAVFDYFQQIRQFKKNAETILLRYGKRNPQHSLYGTFEGSNYRIERDSKALRITVKDGRGEIFNYPSDLHTRNPEKKAVSNLNREDVELFSSIAQEIKQERREAPTRWQKEQSRKRQQGRGLER